MKIVQINTYDISGGAARAAYRLHKGLRQSGEDCLMLVRYKVSSDASVHRIDARKGAGKPDEAFHLEQIQRHYINAHRTDISNTIFSLPYPGYDLTETDLVRAADIINLHWVAWYQSVTTLQRLFSMGKPVVWTLHDQWAFTGGCHYSAGCNKYLRYCSNCPQLSDDPHNLAKAVLKDKLALFKGANITIATPSKWLGDCARKSTLFKNLRVEVIANSLETDIFRPVPKPEAKKILKIPADTVTLLFGAHTAEEKRKGFGELIAAMHHCKSHPEFQKLLNEKKITVLCFGQPAKELTTIGIPFLSLGYLDSDEKVRNAYSAADMFILPSLEDNLPNTMLEALSCETPVVAFNVGGIPDVVKDDINGKLAPANDTRSLAKAILDLITDPQRRENMGKKGREQILNGYALSNQANNYLSLYRELFDKKNQTSAVMNPPETPAGVNEPVFAVLDTSIGPYFKKIYDRVLFKALKDYVSVSKKEFEERLNACEVEQSAKLERLSDLESNFKRACEELHKTGGDLSEFAGIFETQKIDFGTEEASIFLLSGWGHNETFPDEGYTFNWAMGNSASLFLALSKETPLRMTAHIRSLEFPEPQIITVKVDDKEIGKWKLSNKWQWEEHSITIGPDDHRSGVSIIEFEFSQNMKEAHDTRPLAVLFESLTLQLKTLITKPA